MALTRTVVAVAALAVFAQLALATCSCGCGGSGSYSSGGSDSYSNGGYSSGGSDSYRSGGSVSYSSGGSDSGCGASYSARESWTNIPSNAYISNSPVEEQCAYREIAVADEAVPAVGIVQQSRPVCAQHLSYDIEVPVEQQTEVRPSYHSVSVHVPVRAKVSKSLLGSLPYDVEVPVEQQECVKMNPLDVEIAVPVRQRQVETRLHSTYTMELPAEQSLPSRLTNLKAQVDRVVLPSRETCLPPNNGPANLEQVQYVAVPVRGPDCVSPFDLLKLPKSTESFSSRSKGCVCPCD